MHDRSTPSWRLLLASFVFLALFSYGGQQLVLADHTPEPTAVTVAGSLQDELGCPGDWQPECTNTYLTYDAADGVWQAVFDVPAGSWEYKAALNNGWDENYGANAQPGGANIGLNVAAGTAVKFFYDHQTHWITDNVNSVIATIPGSFQSQLGCPGDWQPDCLQSWLQDPDGDGTYSFSTTSLAPGSYEAKVTINEAWDENYGVGGEPNGANIPFTVVNAGDEVLFTYDPLSHILTIEAGVEPPALDYAVIHYNRPGNDYDGWGLHLWGEAIAPSEGTAWSDPKPFSGFDAYGAYVAVKLADPSKPVNYIIHKGDEKDTANDRNFVPATIPVLWLQQGDEANYDSRAAATGHTIVHYQRPNNDYDGWGLHLWGAAIDPAEATDWLTPKPPTGFDDYGAYFEIALAFTSQPVNFIAHLGDIKDPDADLSYTPADHYEVWVKSGDTTVYGQKGAATDTATIHYHRPFGDYDGWGLHLWTGFDGSVTWGEPFPPAGEDSFGVYFEVPLVADAPLLNYIIHKGDEKDPGPDQALIFADTGYEIWQIQGNGTQFTDPAIALAHASGSAGDLGKQQAYWVNENTIAWPTAADRSLTFQLHYAADASLDLGSSGVTGGSAITLELGNGLDGNSAAKFPHLATLPTLTIPADALAMVPEILKGQFAVSAMMADGTAVDATGLQIPGVLDDLYTYHGDLGVVWGDNGVPTIRLWAPTAQNVTLHLFADSDPATSSTTYPMTWDAASGTWSLVGEASWEWQYYLYEVEVFAPSTGNIEHNIVTDPYTFSLAMNSKRSQIVNLESPDLKPEGWDTVAKPALAAPEDITVYELHVRDFSANDLSVPEADRGTFKAFTDLTSNGMQHLQALAAAGLSHLHLLPSFDIATINEDKSTWQAPDPSVLAGYAPDSDQQQAAVAATENLDGFNWGYDPFHYTVPEGSYSTNPDGPTRILEFREMVQALNEDVGVRVVMDVVYNHTNAAGQAEKSVLDRIVPGYYHRLNANGQVESSTCCANTATEHNMMEKLMIDSLLVWATEYKVDAFRFDLMGHHMLNNMIHVRDALHALTPAANGVDGNSIYLYGEGWNFGEVADNARGVNATQLNVDGTGIGTFSDRLRDAVRGAGPFDSGQDLLRQGFASGLYYDPNASNQGSSDDQLARLLLLSDQIRVGMAGNLADYQFTDRTGNLVTGAEVDYNGQPTGYTADPQENISYVSKHDNQTLYDIYAYGLPQDTPMAERVRAQNVALSTAMLGQGVPFFQAGSDMLRSKSLDRDSYDSGDWFNRLDFTYQSNNFGVGLPIARVNESNWPVMQPILANPSLMPTPNDIELSADLFQELLAIRSSSPLFRLHSAADVQARLAFHNTGPDQLPGLIVMTLSDQVGLSDIDPNYEMIVVLLNANDEAQSFAAPLAGLNLVLHPVQANSIDTVVQGASFDSATGTFSVPGRTTAVFVLPQTTPEHRAFFPIAAYHGSPLGGGETNDPLAETLVRAPVSHAVQDDVFYFVMPDRFANGNTANDLGGVTSGNLAEHGYKADDKAFYHGGDLQGMIDHLDYLEGLGITAVWMTPIFRNNPTQSDGSTEFGFGAAYHGYWIIDFENADPHLGSNEDLTAFINAAHSRGIKVFFDIVLNHTGDIIDYAEQTYNYRNKEEYPYLDAEGNLFDDSDYAAGDTFPELDAATSFPYTPVFRDAAGATAKSPAWLNDPTYYHNRGDSSFVGENSVYGDFFGLDDLFTEQPAVRDGLIELYKQIITDFNIDGYRIDTVKHVNIELWQKFGPEIMAHAQAEGKTDFFMFGEVFDGNPAFMSRYTTAGNLPSVLDFGLQGQANGFATGANPTNNLRDLFANDDYFTDADSNAYMLANFVSNHDIGRIGRNVQNSDPDTAESEWVARSTLGHALMYFSRGFPVVYYGDEQGFTGDGGDKDAREDMMASQVAVYNDNNLIGSDDTTAIENFDQNHPLYQMLADLAAVREEHVALRRGAQIHRFSSDGPGVYAFSRIDREEQVEYLVVLNNAEVPKLVTIPTYTPSSAWTAVYPASAPGTHSNVTGHILLTVPPLSVTVYQAAGTVPPSSAAPSIAFSGNVAAGEVFGRAEISVSLGRNQLAEVTFAVKGANDADYTILGTDTNAPYRVFYDVSDLPLDTSLTFAAVVNDLNGHLRVVKETAVTVTDPNTVPDAGYAVLHYNRPVGDYDGWGLHLWGNAIDPSEATEWTAPKQPNGEDEYGVFFYIKLANPNEPLNFIIHKSDEKDTPNDRSLVPANGAEIWLMQDDAANHASQAAARGETTIHYNRPGGDYGGWGLHLWGDALAPGEGTDWATPKLPDGFDDYGAYFNIALADSSQPVNFIIHNGDAKDTDADRSYVPDAAPNLWLAQGDATNHAQRGAVENFVTIHYHRPGGDYGDATSDNYNDFWGLHVWTGAASGVDWTNPLRPAGSDRFGVTFRVDLAANATELAYILHRGDNKDLPDDQFLNLADFGYEVWILQATPGYLLPMP